MLKRVAATQFKLTLVCGYGKLVAKELKGKLAISDKTSMKLREHQGKLPSA